MALSGNLSETSFTDLIQFYSISRQTAAVTLVSAAGDAVFYVQGGDVVDARFGEVTGVEAVRRALRLKEGEFRVELNQQSSARTIFEPWSKVILEELCAADEASNLDVSGAAPLEHAAEAMPMIANETKPAARGRSEPPAPQKGGKGVFVGVAVVAVVIAGAIGVVVWQRANAERQAEALAARQMAEAQALAQARAPSHKNVQGVTDTEIVFGMAAPFSGPAKELGRGMKTGIDIAFAAANDAGGINGRRLRLIALDDGYEPERTKAVMKELAQDRKVFGFIGNVGTPTAEVAVPYALEKKLLFFGPFTGAGLLRRDPPDRYVFNYRASYAEETAATVKYLVEIKRIKPAEIAVFAQEDGYGDAGFNGVARMLRKYGRDPAHTLRVGYKRNTADVQQAVDEVLKSRQHIRAVVMVPTYKAAAQFVGKVKAARPDMLFTSVSFVGASALSDELMSLGPKVAEGVIVTQVVPLPTSRSTAVLRYQSLLPKYSVGEKPEFISLEGYLDAELLIEGLRRAGRDFDMESFVDSLEAMRGVDLGVGATMSFGLSEHQASHKVWGTVLDSTGNFQPLELE